MTWSYCFHRRYNMSRQKNCILINEHALNREPGARFSKVPIINRPVKLLLFTCKVEVSIVLHLTWQNYQLMKQHRVVASWFENLISGPKRYRGFRETGPCPFNYRSFSNDVTAAIFVYKTMNRRPCLCTKKILWELNSFHMLKLSFLQSNRPLPSS